MTVWRTDKRFIVNSWRRSDRGKCGGITWLLCEVTGARQQSLSAVCRVGPWDPHSAGCTKALLVPRSHMAPLLLSSFLWGKCGNDRRTWASSLCFGAKQSEFGYQLFAGLFGSPALLGFGNRWKLQLLFCGRGNHRICGKLSSGAALLARRRRR